MIHIPNISDTDRIPRCQAILEHPLYIKHYERLLRFEKDRIFCRHTFEHFMDVGRIAYIINLEKELGISKEIIYTVALLHDIGRAEQYENNTPHEKAGADISKTILTECGYSDDEIKLVTSAILSHRGNKTGEGRSCGNAMSKDDCKDESMLSDIICFADKASRQCFRCSAFEQCNWSMDKRNLEVRI